METILAQQASLDDTISYKTRMGCTVVSRPTTPRPVVTPSEDTKTVSFSYRDALLTTFQILQPVSVPLFTIDNFPALFPVSNASNILSLFTARPTVVSVTGSTRPTVVSVTGPPRPAAVYVTGSTSLTVVSVTGPPRPAAVYVAGSTSPTVVSVTGPPRPAAVYVTGSTRPIKFKGAHSILSNFYPCSIRYKGKIFLVLNMLTSIQRLFITRIFSWLGWFFQQLQLGSAKFGLTEL
jgi:hypothetical protein